MSETAFSATGPDHSPSESTGEPSAESPADEPPHEGPRAPARPDDRLSLAQFLTDGSLSRLFAELTALVGVRVELRDERGRLILPSDAPPGWTLADAPDPPEDAILEPLDVAGTVIGFAVIHPGAPAPGDATRTRLRGAVRYLMAGAADLCEQEVELWGRLREMRVLHRLSSMLVRGESMDRVLRAALESALDVLDLHAGSVVLFPEDAEGPASNLHEAELVLKASIGLSDAWLNDSRPLSRDRRFDREALAGEVVRVHDLRRDPRVNIPDLVRTEGLISALQAGMAFQDQAIGVMRLYSRSPRVFTDADARLAQVLANQAATAVEQARLLRAKRHEEQLQQQVRLGAAVQRRMLPERVPSMARFDVAFRYVPSLELGGDFLDVFEIGPKAAPSLAVAVGDVVGKGLPAALLMSACRASLRAHAQADGQADVPTVLAHVNRDLCRDTLDNEFVTVWLGALDASTARLTYCSAGHDPPILVRAPDQPRRPGPEDVRMLSAEGLVIGIDEGQSYRPVSVELLRGDVLVCYTDGLIDARSFLGERFGRDRLRSAVLHGIALEPDAPAQVILERIFWELRSFTGLKGQVDDQTVVVVRVR
ncbi:MAG: SpoIIE family protein phosphatase [Phycisphaeraceae bacterium]|nr:SpoIIE family protein phosphatase [Phycisphaeraceae bacterium]